MSENCRKCAGRLVAAKLQTLTELARLARFERATAWFVARYSIQLSYRRVRGGTIGMRSFRVKDLRASGSLVARFPWRDVPHDGTCSRYNQINPRDIAI